MRSLVVQARHSKASSQQESAAKKVLSTPATQQTGQCEDFVAVALVDGIVLRAVATFIRRSDIDRPRNLV